MAKATHLLRKASELVKQRKYADAVEVYLQATETAPGDSRAWFGLGVCLYKVGNLEVAHIALERAEQMGYPRAGEALQRVAEAEKRRAAEEEPEEGAPTAREAPPEEQKVALETYLRVMVVENIDRDRQAIVEALEGAIGDIEVSCVDYGVSTSDTMSGTVHYDVAVLDWDSDPDAAAGLIHILKIKRPSLFVVCLTDRWNPDRAAAIFEAGADYHLPKQENFADLLPRLIAQWARRDRAMTLQIRAEAAEEEQTPWPAALDALGEMLVLVAPDYDIIQANQAAMKGFRRGEDELIGRTYSTILHGEEQPPDSCPFLKALQAGEPAEGEVGREGQQQNFYVRAWPVTSPAGKVSAAVGLIQPVPAGEVSEAVKDRERLYRRLAEGANAGIFLVGPQGTVRYANQSLCGMLNCTGDELAGRPVESIITPQDQESFRELLEVAVDIGSSGGRLNLQGETGARLPAEVRLGRFSSSDQTFLVATAIEVSELEEAEQELWGETRRLSGMLEAGMDALECGVAVLDERGRITWVNQTAEELLGADRDALFGEDYLETLRESLTATETVTSELLDELERAHQSGEPLPDYALQTAPDAGGPITYWSSPVENPSPGVSRVEHFYAVPAGAGVARTTGEELPPGMADVVSGLVFKTDRDGRLTWCNPGAADTTGYPPKRLDGLHLVELATQQGRRRLRSLLQEVLRSGRPVRGEEILLKRRDGTRFWGEVALLPLRSEDGGRVEGVRGIVRDITDRKVNEAIRSVLEGEVPT